MKEIQTLLEQSSGARFLAADLHIHTQASPDTDKKWQALGPEEVVNQALAKGLDIIAVTDHNTAEYCDKVIDAAQGTTLHVFPGVEISTRQGHLLAIFETDKTSETINGFLMNAGIKQAELGKDSALATGNMDEVAKLVEEVGGVAIAAHVDGEKGFMRMVKVGADKARIHACRAIRAFEITDTAKRDVYLGGKMPGYSRRVPCVQSSDCHEAEGGGFHQLDSIGSRLCFLKMDDISIQGIKQALLDPDMRVRFVADPSPEPEYVIEGLWVNGGFLQGQQFRFSDHVSCLIGGTGVGKSLTVELIRFVFDRMRRSSLRRAIVLLPRSSVLRSLCRPRRWVVQMGPRVRLRQDRHRASEAVA
ncbi:MAG: PHP domain-containing protein [Dehalococcoidia bacterium]|nr:PHP domain-containing protein [Dehalococcoidia bacterium]